MLTPPISERLGIVIADAYAALIDAKTAALAPHDLTVARYAVLGTLYTADGSSGAALARACGVTPQTISELLVSLEAEGLIERRAPTTGRAITTHLTELGRARVVTADRDAGAIEVALADTFTPDERAQLRDLLTRATRALENPAAGKS
ncbi:MarR family winged helix-turn-helix transcriptional regulator [Millisia brevis]|uniref:MarR family winged helix-turn-helix transcriptional regulator n=1 Tax=Millisia brevis TaxID=264148 RepID=UPI0012ECC985|nr:MarR family transcriptional regulator [Millisia brevis]